MTARKALVLINWHTSMFEALLILHIPQKGLLVLGSIECLVFRINNHSFVPLSKRAQHPKRIGDMCNNTKHASHWCYFRVVFGPLLSH
jgi:hypothetical protein